MNPRPLTKLDQSILGIVRSHVGVAHAIKIREVMELLCMEDTPQTQRAIKQSIENLRRAGHYRVGTSRGTKKDAMRGLYWIETPSDWQASYDCYKKQAQSMFWLVTRAYKACFPELAHQQIFNFDEDKAA